MSSKKIPLTRVVGRRKTAASNARSDDNAEPKAEGGVGRLRLPRLDPSLEPDATDGEQPPRKRQDPADIAATIMLEWALVVQAVSAEELRRPGTVCTVKVPSGEWAEPACKAWAALVSAELATTRAEWFFGFERRSPESVAFVRSRAPDKYEREHDGDTVGEAIWRGHCIVGFSPEVDWLPPDLVAAADHRLRITPLYVDGACELARRMTGTEPTIRLTAAEAAAAGPRLLRLASRPDQTADAYLGKLRELVQAAVVEPPLAKRAAAVLVRDGITLEDLAGMDEAVAWGLTLRDDLAAFRENRRPWADVDCGILLSGPTGCGKTTYAKALARTCGVPLVQGSWSRWLANGSGHQGDFMLAMKKSFAEARASAPCILVLDEIDSFPDRATLTHDQKDWDIQCVNALLAELDGVQGREGVVVVGACNHPHLLDAALTRSGRLDGHVRIGLPDRAALTRIMRVHLDGDLPGEDLDGAALLSLGSSGADVERLVRGARRRARNAGRPMELTDLLAEIGGSDDRSPAERMVAAVHEAGHAIAAGELGIPIEDVSILGNSTSGGHLQGRTMRRFPTAADIHHRLVFLLAGRAAEEVVLGCPTAGAGGSAGSDLARSSWLAATARSELGLGEGCNLLWASIPDHPADLRAVFAADPTLAGQVRDKLTDAYGEAVDLVVRRRPAVEAVANALVERLVLEAQEVRRLAAAFEEPPRCG